MNHTLYCEKIKKAAALPFPITVRYLENATSTNAILCDEARGGEKRTVLLIAETQSAGRGRFDRRFFSPPGTGIYMSLLLHPTFSPALFSLITPLAGAAAAEAAETVFGGKVGIKWVNDLYQNGKKVAGILAESGFCGSDAYLVLGIGINVYPPSDMPEELFGLLGTLSDKAAGEEDKRPALIGAFLSRFFAYYAALPEKTFLPAYRCRSVLTDKKIFVHNAAFDTAKTGEGRAALCLGIGDDASLLVRYENGEEAALTAGEVTLSFPDTL